LETTVDAHALQFAGSAAPRACSSCAHGVYLRQFMSPSVQLYQLENGVPYFVSRSKPAKFFQ
jgi:hypothetical protein